MISMKWVHVSRFLQSLLRWLPNYLEMYIINPSFRSTDELKRLLTRESVTDPEIGIADIGNKVGIRGTDLRQ